MSTIVDPSSRSGAFQWRNRIRRIHSLHACWPWSTSFIPAPSRWSPCYNNSNRKHLPDMPTALLSVSDKSGLVDFAKGLIGLGWNLISTGGTAKTLRGAGVAVRDVSEITHFPEMLDGRVKTLHPAIHGALLARRDSPEHLKALAEHQIAPIDLVAVNLYPFEETAARAGAKLEEIIEQIDIGGPSMLRSAAKNFASVFVIVDPADYGRVLAALEAKDDDLDLRRLLAEKVFARTAAYDAAIAYWFGCERSEIFPDRIAIALEKATTLRYGENPGQRAAFYVERQKDGLSALEKKGGKELSFNNLLDLEGALHYKRVRGGFLAQERAARDAGEEWRVVTKRQPTDVELKDLQFAWRAVGSVKSNAIVLARDGATIGIGAGQMSRVDAAFLSVYKARLTGHDTKGSVLGSDAYFPFRDGVEQAAEAGVSAIVQPGGSIRDEEVIKAADEYNIAMVFTGKRQFRH